VSRGTVLALVLVGLYLASRLTGLTTLPIFLDETQLIYWAVEIADGEKWLRPWNYGKARRRTRVPGPDHHQASRPRWGSAGDVGRLAGFGGC
jgi:hypothetical protein